MSLNVTFTFLSDQVEDFISLSQTPLDGSQLTDIMHNRYMVWLLIREFLTTVYLLTKVNLGEGISQVDYHFVFLFVFIFFFRGINMRYLGKLATLLSMREDLEHVYVSKIDFE